MRWVYSKWSWYWVDREWWGMMIEVIQGVYVRIISMDWNENIWVDIIK